MTNVRFLIKGARIFLLTILLILTSFVVIADKKTKTELIITEYKEITNNKNDRLTKASNQILGKHIKILRGWAEGNATSGKVIGFRGKIAKINFNYFKIEWYHSILK